ncbi:MAG: hypothetical protein HY077_03475 [Elusimicrobia bacterium]|nr:hypothetical protein [Elusimicrobiota bacterium]
MTRAQDVLDTPAIRAHTARVQALQEKERDAEARRAYVVAAIGDELIATKAALDRTSDKTAWMRWLTDHIDVQRSAAENYMRVARLRKNYQAFGIFARVPSSALYVIAELSDPLLQKLAADPRLPSPKTGAPTRIDQMSARDLLVALEILRGRKKQPKLPKGSRDQLAQAAIGALRGCRPLLEAVNQGTGKLDPANKRELLAVEDELREVGLHWKAWVTPQKGRRLA